MTFLVFVTATTVLGSVIILYSVATAASFSDTSWRIAQTERSVRTDFEASNGLLEASEDKFCRERSAEVRFSARSDFAAVANVRTMPSKRVNNAWFPGNSVRLRRISIHLTCSGFDVSAAT